MAGYVLHLLHGKMFLEQSNLNFSKDEQTQFYMGLLIPDANKKTNGENSHFFDSSQNGKILQMPNLDNFSYRILIDQPFVLGYTAHLYLDKLFFKDYFVKFVNFLDADGNLTDEKKKVEKVLLVKDNKYISINELFSENYLYGDYTMLNQYLVKKYCIDMIDFTYVNNPIKEVDVRDFSLIQKSLEKYLKSSSGKTKMNVFNVESLECAIERYAFGFAQWIKGIKSALKFFK